jgi:hypothetical protein
MKRRWTEKRTRKFQQSICKPELLHHHHHHHHRELRSRRVAVTNIRTAPPLPPVFLSCVPDIFYPSDHIDRSASGIQVAGLLSKWSRHTLKFLFLFWYLIYSVNLYRHYVYDNCVLRPLWGNAFLLSPFLAFDFPLTPNIWIILKALIWPLITMYNSGEVCFSSSALIT